MNKFVDLLVVYAFPSLRKTKRMFSIERKHPLYYVTDLRIVLVVNSPPPQYSVM
uniref:Uncharacterized protein n=1 Tax=Arundo donax TaxID=35708 RepID=A0A0A9HQB8_ARUDO